MIAAVGSVLLTPWNWYNSDEGILYTLGILGALIGPLFGILIAGYYLVSKQRVWVDDMYSMDTTRRYWFRNGYNPNAVCLGADRRRPGHRSGAASAARLVAESGERDPLPRSATSAGSSAAGSASSPSRSSSAGQPADRPPRRRPRERQRRSQLVGPERGGVGGSPIPRHPAPIADPAIAVINPNTTAR